MVHLTRSGTQDETARGTQDEMTAPHSLYPSETDRYYERILPYLSSDMGMVVLFDLARLCYGS
jgi:hypothetical protein